MQIKTIKELRQDSLKRIDIYKNISYKLKIKSNDTKKDLKDTSTEIINHKRENCLYPNMAINEKNINGVLYPINKKDIVDYDINNYDKNEIDLIVKSLKNKGINNDFLNLLDNEFKINSNNLFIRGINKDNMFKDFCRNFIKYCLDTKLIKFTKKDIKDLLSNMDKCTTTKNNKVNDIIDYLINIGFITDTTINKQYWFFRIIKSKTYDGLSINQNELNKYVNDKNIKDLFNLVNVENSIKPKLTFKPYGYTMFKNGYVRKYYIYKDSKKTYITHCNIFEDIKPMDLKIKVFNKVFNMNIDKKTYLKEDSFIIKNSLTHNKPIKILKNEFREIYKNLNISSEVMSNKKPIYQNVTTINTLSHKLVNRFNSKKGYKVNMDFDISKLIKPINKSIKPNTTIKKVSYKDLLNLLKK